MHAAKVDRSARLRRVLNLLSHGVAMSTLDIIRLANVAAVSAAVSELRQQGYNIECKRKGDIWLYSMKSRIESLREVGK